MSAGDSIHEAREPRAADAGEAAQRAAPEREVAGVGGTAREKSPAGDPQGDLWDRRLRIEDICEALRAVRTHFEKTDVSTRRRVVELAVRPVLRPLGWDAEDPAAVTSDFETPAGAVDFALCHPTGEPRILVSVGALPRAAEAHGTHPFEDCSIQALQLAVPEDGRVWRLHFPAGRGSIRNREFVRFDVVDGESEDVAEALDAHLSFHAAKSGRAFRAAARTYGERRFAAEARAAWRRALAGPEVLDGFLREMEEAMGVPADRDRAKAFVGSQAAGIQWAPDPPDPRPARKVGVGDRVHFCNLQSREIDAVVVVGGEPDWDRGEVSRHSPFGTALFGACEGEERVLALPNQEPVPVRIVLIRGRSG